MLLWSARAASLIAVGVACYLTLSPDPAGAGTLPGWVAHLGVFAGVGASFALLRRVSHWPASRLPLLAFGVAFLGAATEVGQSFTGRNPDLIDLVFDIAGGIGTVFVGDRVFAALERRAASD